MTLEAMRPPRPTKMMSGRRRKPHPNAKVTVVSLHWTCEDCDFEWEDLYPENPYIGESHEAPTPVEKHAWKHDHFISDPYESRVWVLPNGTEVDLTVTYWPREQLRAHCRFVSNRG